MNAKYTRTAAATPKMTKDQAMKLIEAIAAIASGNVQGAKDILEALAKPAPPPPPGLPIENSSRSRRPGGAR
jgi:hypothetical protein